MLQLVGMVALDRSRGRVGCQWIPLKHKAPSCAAIAAASYCCCRRRRLAIAASSQNVEVSQPSCILGMAQRRCRQINACVCSGLSHPVPNPDFACLLFSPAGRSCC
jgi:hypothetical protein